MTKQLDFASIALLAMLCTGCASVRMYPICFYDKKPDADTLDRTYVSALKKAFTTVTGSNPDDMAISPDVRWIVASVTNYQDASLLKMWPRIGCIGPAGSTSEVKSQVDCISYVEDFIKEKKYSELGQYKGVSGSTYYNESRDQERLVYCAKRE